MHIKCRCPLLTFGHALSSSPEMGLGEKDMAVPGRDDFGRGGNGGT
jgi:hypothetical protein